ncbi:MAG: choice-of-anchor B family protein [Acidimicrobiales bacterium]
MRHRRVATAVAIAAIVTGASLVVINQSSARDAQPNGAIPNEMSDYQGVIERGAPARGPSGFEPCVRGMAGGTYPCDGVDLMSHVSLEDMGVTFVNDIWGWTDPRTRKDYALVAATEGTVIVDISDSRRPDIVGTLPAHSLDPDLPFWKDIKVFDDHMYVGSEQRGHGLQVFDLTELRRVRHRDRPVTFEETAHYAEFDTSHNININTETGFLYAVGIRNADRSFNCGGGLHMVDINDPDDPSFAGCFSDENYIHDTQCVIYRGPDRGHRGQEICFNSNAADEGHFVSIVDVTDKANPVELAREGYAESAYSHQGWLTPDQGFFLHNDELDEVTHGLNTRVRVWDVRDLDNPVMTLVADNDATSIGHNLYTEGDVTYASNYTSGLRVYDSSRVSRPALPEVAFFDIYPENDNPTFEGGTWSNYPYFRQRDIVAVSSIDRGLFVLRPERHR